MSCIFSAMKNPVDTKCSYFLEFSAVFSWQFFMFKRLTCWILQRHFNNNKKRWFPFLPTACWTYTMSPYRLQSLHSDSTYIHVNPGDIFKPVTNYSLPHRPVDDRGVLSLIGGLCSHLSLTADAGQPVVPFIYRVSGRARQSRCERRSLVLLTKRRWCQV